MTYLPRIMSKREPESLINEIRVDRGLFIHELCEQAKINHGTFNNLVSGVTSPFYVKGSKKGLVRDSVTRLLRVLRTDIATAFPRYACEWERLEISESNYEYYNGMTRSQVVDSTHGSYNIDGDARIDIKRILEKIFDVKDLSVENLVDLIANPEYREPLVNNQFEKSHRYIQGHHVKLYIAYFVLAYIYEYNQGEIQLLVKASQPVVRKYTNKAVNYLRNYRSELLNELKDCYQQPFRYSHL